ncbi:hypothetical protein KI387_016751, partial [Taxus chinensis]
MGGVSLVSLWLPQIQQTLMIGPSPSVLYLGSMLIYISQRRSTSVDVDLQQSTPIILNRRRSPCRQ